MTHERTPQTASTPSEGTSQGGCIVAALRILARDIYCEDGVATQCIREAADEIERLREAIRRLAEQDATLSVQGGNVTVTMDATLTDAEREAVAWANADDDGIYEVGLSEGDAHCVLERAQNGNFANRNPRIVPLYRSPTITDEEREAIEKAIGRELDAEWYGGPEPDRVVTLRSLLERLG